VNSDQIESWIITAVCKRFNVTKAELLAGGHHRIYPVPDARSVAAYLMRRLTDLSWPGIAKVLNWHSHTTAIAASRGSEIDGELNKIAMSIMADAPEPTHASEGTDLPDSAATVPVEVSEVPQGRSDAPAETLHEVQATPRFSEHRAWVDEVIERIRQPPQPKSRRCATRWPSRSTGASGRSCLARMNV
jgi:hypothetical protein